MYDSEKGNFAQIVSSAVAVVVAILSVVAYGAFVTMIWFGAMYGLLGLFRPLGFFDSGLAFWATFFFLAGFRFISTARIQRA